MRISEMNWMMVEEYLRRDDRCVLPLGSTEQHAHLSLSVDSILAERVALEAAEPLGVPVFPVLAYGLTPNFVAYPGTITLHAETFLRVVEEILDALAAQGFRRILIVNGHGGNSPAGEHANAWATQNPQMRVRFHNWWNASKTIAQVDAIDPIASHASWMENFPWTRLANVATPEMQKPMIDPAHLRTLTPAQVREHLGDGNFGGFYQRTDSEMEKVWRAAVEETRALLNDDWL